MNKNIILNYVFTANFNNFLKRYKYHISSAILNFPLLNVNGFSNPNYSEIRLVNSTFIRSRMERELIHVLVN